MKVKENKQKPERSNCIIENRNRGEHRKAMETEEWERIWEVCECLALEQLWAVTEQEERGF